MGRLLRPQQSRLRTLLSLLYRHRIFVTIVAIFIIFIEPLNHVHRAYAVPRPRQPLDEPFTTVCLDPSYSKANTPRQSAAIVMLARNSDLFGAMTAVRSVETKFNQHFNYPYVFLNDEPYSAEFKASLSAEVSGEVEFATIPKHMWGWSPRYQDDEAAKNQARAHWADMAKRTGTSSGSYMTKEAYHHMCRFNSGFFFDHPALLKYRWYWRIEPDVEYTCAITYDPFALMAANNKTYGYTIALWEVGSTSPNLFRAVSDYADAHLPSRTPAQDGTWRAMHDPSWAPWPLRRLVVPHLGGPFHSRNSGGDSWNFCHFWSNFEIADLEFFRSPEYRTFFEHLDNLGGFHSERWGDAPVHSLAAALLLEPHQLHYFQDFGYRHPPFQHCPVNEGVGCRCECNPNEGKVVDVCLRTLRAPVEPP